MSPQGPVLLFDANGIYLSSLDRAIEEQKAYYTRKGKPNERQKKPRR
jgi:hypothetical protein